jgi:hypothetical protein
MASSDSDLIFIVVRRLALIRYNPTTARIGASVIQTFHPRFFGAV